MSGVWLEHADCREFKYPWDANIIFCDPPQTTGRNNARQLIRDGVFDYFTKGWIAKANQYLTQDGVLVVFCLPEFQCDYERLLRRISTLYYQQTIIWHYNFGLYTKKRFVSSHMPILIYGRSMKDFDWREITVESQRQKDGDSRADARGRVPGDVWDIPRMPGNSNQRYSSEPQLPVQLIYRILKAYKARRVIDMMTGNGSVPALCKYLQIPCIGTEIDEQMYKIATERVLEKFDESRLH